MLLRSNGALDRVEINLHRFGLVVWNRNQPRFTVPDLLELNGKAVKLFADASLLTVQVATPHEAVDFLDEMLD